jgi:1-deoxy-D-xylulose-5-phosphate synthase
VTLLIDRAGNVGEDGETHHGVFDLSYLRHIPNMRILAPSDAVTLRAALIYSLTDGSNPVAIRYPKGTVREDIKVITLPKNPPSAAERAARAHAMADFLKSAKSRVLREGGDVTVFSVGCMTETALAAADLLAPRGTGVRVVDALFVKPIDETLVAEAIERGAPIITMEDNMLAGGFGEAVNSVLVEKNEPLRYMPRVLNIGWPDEFVPHGERSVLMREYGLDAASVASRIAEFIRSEAIAI